MTITEEKLKKLKDEISLGRDISIINLIDCLVEKAHENKASDIHIDPGVHNIRVRFRIDGVLQEAFEFPKSIHNEIISRIVNLFFQLFLSRWYQSLCLSHLLYFCQNSFYELY